jgi:hypothetical protein
LAIVLVLSAVWAFTHDARDRAQNARVKSLTQVTMEEEGETYAIQSLAWKWQDLEIIYSFEIPPGERGYGHVLRPWFMLGCDFWDEKDDATGTTAWIEGVHPRAFLEGSTCVECVPIAITPPSDAHYVTITLGKVRTRKVEIPAKPDTLQRAWRPVFKRLGL